MIKVFLVEDEAIIRRGIRDNIDWNANGFEFAGEAGDGEYAYPLILKTEPDILLTDVKMPFMDGLELSRLVKKALPQTKIIILSGYNEFDYAKEAIKIGISDYLLKPVTSANLIDALKKVAETIREEREKSKLLERYFVSYEKYTEFLDKTDYSGVDRKLIEDFSYIVLPRDRIGIVGKNGSGKSTLVKLLCGLVPPDSGEVIRGETVKIGYFSQESEELDPKQRVIDVIRDIAEDIHTKQGVITASQMLERFLFPGELQYRRVENLSGGERRRLLLLCVLMGSPNLLFLDEPTNDLDIQTLQVLEEYLENFAGAVIAVSHDRYFLDRVTEKGFALMGDGHVQPFLGGYSAYLEARRQAEAQSQGSRPAKPATPREKTKTKFSYHEQREYDTIEQEIETLELTLDEIKTQMAQAGSDYVALQRLTEEQQTLETKIEQKMDRWAELEEMAQRMRS